jgi:ATP-dependent Clp protease ATP-binding subunit ClpA
VLTQQKLTAVTSDKCGISLVLFDEVEKAAPTVHRMLLGIMDRGSIRTGENQPVSFEKSMIFLTSNLGAQEANRDLAAYGLAPAAPFSHTKRESVSIAACKRRFSPEFMNRLDSIVVYQRLTTQALTEIVELELRNIDFMIAMRGAESFRVTFSQASKDFLLAHGTSAEYGARELKRVIHRNVTQRLARLLATGELAAGDAVLVDAGAEALTFRVRRSRAAL